PRASHDAARRARKRPARGRLHAHGARVLRAPAGAVRDEGVARGVADASALVRGEGRLHLVHRVGAAASIVGVVIVAFYRPGIEAWAARHEPRERLFTPEDVRAELVVVLVVGTAGAGEDRS